jgi:hypothetical protein
MEYEVKRVSLLGLWVTVEYIDDKYEYLLIWLYIYSYKFLFFNVNHNHNELIKWYIKYIFESFVSI